MSASNKREDGAGRAPACAAFACCVCRRIVTLDGRGVACGAGLPLALPSSMCTAPSVVAAAAAAASPLRPPSGVFLKTSRVLHVEDTVAERRRRRDQRASLLKARDEAWRDQQRQHQENVKGSGGGDAEAALDEWEEQETAHRQLLHPAIRGSLLSAAGKYTPLAPSPLTPWLNTRYARLKNGLYNTSGTAPATVDARRTMTAEARIVARLSPSFSYQYAWLSAAEAETYIGELWRMLHDAPVPPPGSSTPLTVQCDEFRRGEEQKLQQAEQQQTAGMTTEVTTTPLGSPQLLPSSRRVSQLSFASANNIPSLEGSPTMNLCAPSLVPGRTAPSPLFAVTAITSGCSPRALPTLHMRKIEAMRLHAVDSDSTRRGRTSLTSRIPPKATIPLPQLLSSSAAAAVTAALPSREVYISTFARHLMRRVVHNAGTDLPLCPRCCKEALEMQQKSVGQVVEDVVGLAAAYANPDAVSFVLCYRAGCAREETTRPGLCDASAINTREAPLASSNNDNSNKNSPTSEEQNHHQQWQQDREDGLVGVQNILVNSDVSVSCVVQQEALQRLKLELLEAEAQSRLLSAFLQAFRHEADVLAAQRRVEASALCAKMAAARNAQQVRAFFDVEDAASGVALRMQNAMRSCAFVAKTSAVLLAFPVRTSGVVATIAGLRLGQHPANSAAWRRTPAAKRCSSAETMLPLTAAAVEANSSNEATVLSHTLHMQQGYTRSLLGSREEYVSVAEINNACGSLLRLLQHLIDWHRIPVQNSALRPNGEQSTVEAITARGSPLKVSRRVADFFINEKFFAWKTFGTGCSIVTSCVLEIVSWMTDRLQLLADDVRQHLAREEDENSPVDSSVSSCAAAVLQSLTPPTPPYVVTQDRVDGFSVRHGDVSDELWTIAIKKLLAVVQWCVMASRDVDSLQRLLGEEGDS